MDEPKNHDPNEPQSPPTSARPRRWKRFAKWAAVSIVVLGLCVSYLLKDHIRTLRSLRQVPGTNAYVMDYYVDYNIGQIRAHGMDVEHVEDSLIDVFFPDAIAAIASGVKGWFLDEALETIPTNAEHCSTVVLRTPSGNVLFGRNFDWMHDACLIVGVHRNDSVDSVAVIDLHYLSLDRDDLEQTNLIQRIPLLFAPYYLQDGMNQHGVAVADMSVDGVKTTHDASKPDILHATAMRLILDYAKTTDDAVEILNEYNIHFGATTGHLMIADASGKSAVIEFIDGKMEATSTSGNWQVCTNHQIYGTTEEQCDENCERYRTASDQLANASAAASVDDVMRVMESVSKENWTMWSSVYDLSDLKHRLAYRRHYDTPYNGTLVDPD